MGPLVLLARLTSRDLLRHRWTSVLLLSALTVAATSLVLGFSLHGRTADAYAHTRAVTRGPDVVVGVFSEPGTALSDAQHRTLTALMHDRQVLRSSGPFPQTWTTVAYGAARGGAEVQGRDLAPAQVDQPALTAGRWIEPGAAVLEESFAHALDAHVGDRVRLGDRSFRIVGTAVTAGMTPYPNVCFVGCVLATPTLAATQPGLVWLTRHDAESLVTPAEPLALTAGLLLQPGVDVDAFVAARSRPDSSTAPLLTSWRDIARHDGKLITNERIIVLLGSSLLSLLAIATIALLVGSRLSEETRRIGTLKAIGATPAYVATTLLLQHLLLAVVATGIGTALARAVIPQLETPSIGLLGSAAPSSIMPPAVAGTLGIVIGLTVLTTLITSSRTLRASTVAALENLPRRPRRRGALIALSSRLPTPALLGLRLVARRPQRSLLTAAGIAVAATGLVAVLLAIARLHADRTHLAGGLTDPNAARLDHVMLMLTVLLTALALVEIIFVSISTTIDAQVTLAIAQALGASPAAARAAVAVALALPALVGAAVGLPAGVELFDSLNHSADTTPVPTLGLAAVLTATVLAAAGLAAITARFASHHGIVDVLQTQGE